MAGSMMASGRSSVYPQHFADQRVAPIVPMHAPKPMAPGVDRMLACAEERVVALRRAQQVRSEQKDLGETSRVTWRPPPTRDTRSHVLTPKPTPSTPSCKPSPHVTPKLILASQSAQELLDLSFRKTPKLSRPWSAGDAPPYAPQRQTATTTFDSAIEIYAPKTKPSSGFDAQLRSRVAPVWELLRSTTAALQAQVDEAARVRAQLEAELAERTASASQLEQECARLTAERLEERMAHEADKGALEVALEHERARLSMSPMLESLRSQADEAQAEAAALKAQAEAHSEAQAAALKAQVDEGARLRAQLEAELVERTANASQLEQACARLTAERLEERMAHEADKGALEAEAAKRLVQAVDAAIASTMAKERTRARMSSIVKALSHAADKKAAVSTAIAAMQKKLALSYALRGAAKATKHAEETAEEAEEAKRAQEATNAQALSAEEAAQAAEEAVRAQEGAIKQAIASTREECAHELEAAVEAVEAAAAQRVAAAIEASALEHERARLLKDTEEKDAADAAAALQAQVLDEAARVRAQLEAELAERTASASQLEQECARLTAERLEERMAHEADKGALEAALERDRSRLRAALKASVALGLVAIHEHRGGVQGSSQVPHIDTALGLVASHEHRHEQMSRTSGADTADFEAVTSKQSMMAQDELRRARQQFASEVAKLRMEVTKLRVGIKSVLTLGLSIKDESDQARFFAAKQPTAKLTNVRLVEVTKPTNVRLVEVTKLAKSRVGVSLVMHGRSVIVHHVESTSPFDGKVFPGDVISLASDGIISPKVLDANGLSQYIFAASSLSLCVETPAVLASARSPSISDRSPSISASDLSGPSPSTQQIARGQHVEPTGGLADDPRLLPPRALRAGAPRTVENMVQVLQDAAARAETEVRAKHAELVADYRARTRTAEPLRHTASTSKTTGFSSSSLYRIPRG